MAVKQLEKNKQSFAGFFLALRPYWTTPKPVTPLHTHTLHTHTRPHAVSYRDIEPFQGSNTSRKKPSENKRQGRPPARMPIKIESPSASVCVCVECVFPLGVTSLHLKVVCLQRRREVHTPSHTQTHTHTTNKQGGLPPERY